MTLADEEKSIDETKWMMDVEELVASGLVGEDIFIEFRLELKDKNPHHDHHHFILYRDDQPIPSHRYNVQARGNIVQLTLKQSQKDDSGHYALIAKKLSANDYPLRENDNKPVVRQKIRMNVRVSSDNPEEGEPPVFVRRLTDLSVKVGTRTRFLVEIRSSSNSKVTWHRNDLPVQSGSRFSFVHEGNFYCVDVAPVMVEDQGHWTCMVENMNGRSSCTSCLSVIVPKAYKPPEFVEKLRAVLTETGTVSLECKVVGVPTPVLRWFKDEKEIKAGDVFALRANVDDPTSLGTYACQAVNCMGTACSSSRVHVMGRGSKEGSLKPADTLLPAGPFPVFQKILQDESCRIGDNIILSCQVQVPPWPKAITWYNKEGRVEPNEKYHMIEDGLGTYSIEVKGVEAMDEGEWKCVATSIENVIQFTTCFVAMSIPKNYRTPRFMESLKAVLTDEGLVSFECKVVGFPTPQLTWFKDGQELKPGDVYQLTGTNSLGSYCCIAKNCMGECKSTAELTVEDIQNQLNEEERLQLLSTNEVPKFIKGLRSCEARIHDNFTFTIQVSVSPTPTLSWYRDDQPIVENDKYKIIREVLGACHLEVHKLEFIDQAEWKCVAANDFGHSITSCFLKLIIPKHFKKPKFLEGLRAILSEEGAVNLECKVIGVPQPILKWYKDGVELKPGDIHRIISGQDGTCCLGIYTCEATNCMGSVSSSASLLGFDDRVGVQSEESKELNSPLPHELARNLSLSTIHEERTSQLYDTPQTDNSVTIDDRGEVSFSFDGKEVSVSLYETPDLTEEEAIQIVEMYADQLSEHITEGNIIELPPMRFMKETSTTGNLLMEAVVIDVSPDYFAGEEEAEDLRTEADLEDVSIMDDQMQSILSSYYAPIDEQSGERTPIGSPPPRPPRRKERSDSASSRSEKSDKSQPKYFDLSESYHSAKEPSMHAQLSFQSQDSVDAFADALSSEGLIRTSPKESEMKALNVAEEFLNINEDLHDKIEILPGAFLQSADINEDVFSAALKRTLGTELIGKERKRRKKSNNGSPMLSSKTSSEESCTMDVDDHEPEEKIQSRRNKEKKSKRRDSNSSNKSNKSTKSEKGKKKRKSHNLEQSLKHEDIKLEAMMEMASAHKVVQPDEHYAEEGDGLLESTASSVFTSAGEISERSRSQKERLCENIKILSNPVLILRNTLVDFDNISLKYTENAVDNEAIQTLILEKFVRPVENLCEQMSVIETKAMEASSDTSLMQDVRISLLDTIGGPTEELLRGIELIRSHENKKPEDIKSDLIVLESLTDPVDEIFAGLSRIEYDLKYKEGGTSSIESLKHPIILERMIKAVRQLGTIVNEFKQKSETKNPNLQIAIVRERLECFYQNLNSFVVSLPLDKITGVPESNIDTLIVESLVKPLEKLIRVLNGIPTDEILGYDEITINKFYQAIGEMKTKFETLAIALETYEIESGELGITEKNSQLVSYLNWTIDDISDKLLKLKKAKELNIQKLDDDIPSLIPTSSDEGFEFASTKPGIHSMTNSKEIEKITSQITEAIISYPLDTIDHTELQEKKVQTDMKMEETVESIKSCITVEKQELEEIIGEESASKTVVEIPSTGAISKRAKYHSRLTSLDSATVELDETLSLPEMLLDPLIDVQAKLNSALRHYECQNPTDTSSTSITELSNCLTELRESIALAAHVATSLNISDTLNSVMDLREPLLDFQLALSSPPSSREIILLQEIVRPLNELQELVSATIRSSSVSESSQVILKQVFRMIDEIQEKLSSVNKRKISLEIPIEPVIETVAVKPPDEIDDASLNFNSVHFALSAALAKANKYLIDKPNYDTASCDEKNVTSAHRLISSIENLCECVGDVSVSIGSIVIPEEKTPEPNYDIISEKLIKLQEPLLNLQKNLLTEKHRPEERHLLNDITGPLHTLKEAILEVNNGRPSIILELLEDVEKDVSLIAMEALKNSLEGKIVREESSVCDFTPGDVPRIISKWFDPIENWLTTASTEIDEKEQIQSVVASAVDYLKRQLLKIVIQSSYSQPPSDVALIEEIAELKEPLTKVYEVIATQYNLTDFEVMENLIQPTKHLLGTILDTSLIHHASSVLRPVLEILEELENQIPISIRTATYERTLQGVVRSILPEEFECNENIEDLGKLENIEMLKESAIVKEIVEEKIETMDLDEAASLPIDIKVHDVISIAPFEIIQHETSTEIDEEEINRPEISQVHSDNTTDEANMENIKLDECIELHDDFVKTPANVDSLTDEELLMRRQSQISSATARAEELDLWTLTLLGPLERLACTTLALDRSIDEEVHPHLCRPLDSLYKQIELVVSQINRPAGQSLENDVETIIEGFLCPANQVQTTLKHAVGVWQNTPTKITVEQQLQDLKEACLDLCERLESLKQKLISEAPAQTLQVQKTEASVVETIMAVLEPLQGIQDIIVKVLNETQTKIEQKITNLAIIEQSEVQNQYKNMRSSMEQLTEIIEKPSTMEICDIETKEKVKHIETATARPLEELIEAIVDPNSVRHTSSTPDEIENMKSCSEKKVSEEKSFNAPHKTVKDETKIDLTLDNKKFADDESQVIEDCMISDEDKLFRENVLDNIHQADQKTESVYIQEIQEFTQTDEACLPSTSKEMIENPSTSENLTDNEELKNSISQEEKISVDTAIFVNCIRNVARSELDRQNAMSFESDIIMENIETSVQELMREYPQICQKNVFEETVRDVVVEELQKVKNLQMEYSTSATDESIEVKKEKQLETLMPIQISQEKIQELIRNEFYKLSIKPADEQNFLKNVETKIKNMLLTRPHITPGKSLEENIREVIEQEINEDQLKEDMKSHEIATALQTELISEITNLDYIEKTIENIVVDEIKTNEPLATSSSTHVIEHKIQEIIQDELTKLNIPQIDNIAIVELINAKMQEISVSSPEILNQKSIENIIRNIIIKKIQEQEPQKSDIEVRIGDTDIMTESVDAKLEKQTTIKSEDYEIQEGMPDLSSIKLETHKTSPNLQEYDTEILISENIQEIISQEELNENTEETHIHESKITNVIKTGNEEIVNTTEIPMSGTEIYGRGTEMELLKIADMLQENISEQHIQELVIEEIIEQNAQSLMNDEFLDLITATIHEIIINHPESHIDESLKEAVRNVIMENLKEVEEKIHSDNMSDQSEELKIMPLSPKTESKTDLKDSVITTLAQPMTSAINAENLTTANESNVNTEILKIPMEGTAINDIVHELIIEELRKYHVQSSQEDHLIKVVERKVQELMPERAEKNYYDDTLKNNVQDMVQKTLKEEKIQVFEDSAGSSSPQGQTSPIPDEIVHDLIVDELHKQNIQIRDEGSIMKAIQADIQMLIIQHPEVTELDSLEENIQDIVIKGLSKEKAVLLKQEELFAADMRKVTIQNMKAPSPTQIEVVPEMICDKRDEESFESPDDNRSPTSVEKEIQEVSCQYPKISKPNITKNLNDAICEKLKEKETDTIQVEDHHIINENKIDNEQTKQFVTSQSHPPPPEVVHLLIVEELQKQNIEPSKEGNLIRAVENKIQEMIIHEHELSNLNILEEQIHEVVVDSILQREEAIMKKISLLTPKEEIGKLVDIKIASPVQTKTPCEEVILPLIVEDIQKHNVQPSDEDDLIKAIKTQVQNLIIANPKESNVDAELLKEESVPVLVDDELSKIHEGIIHDENTLISPSVQVTIPSEEFTDIVPPQNPINDIKNPSTVQTQAFSEEVYELIIDELHKQNGNQLEERSFMRAVETKLQHFIAICPEIKIEDIKEEKVHSIVAEVLEEHNALSVISEELNYAEEQKIKIENIDDGNIKKSTSELANVGAVEQVPRTQDQLRDEIPESNINIKSITCDEVINTVTNEEHEENIQDNTNLLKELQSANIGTVVTSILTDLEKNKNHSENNEKTEKSKKEIFEFITPSINQLDVPEEIIHELVIDELHKQNVQISEESNLVQAIETRIFDLIAQHPEILQENILEENVRDIVTEKSMEQKANILEVEHLAQANRQNSKPEIFNHPLSTQIQIPNETVYDMIIDELHKQNIEPLTEEGLVVAIESKIHDLIARHPEMCSDNIIEESIHAIVTELWEEQTVNIIETEGLSKASQQNVKVDVSLTTDKSLTATSQKNTGDDIISQSHPQELKFIKDEEYSLSPQVQHKQKDESVKCTIATEENELEKKEDVHIKTVRSRDVQFETTEKQKTEHLNIECKQITDEVATLHAENLPSNVKLEEKNNIKPRPQREDIQLQTDVKDRLAMKEKEQVDLRTTEVLSLQVPVVTPAINTDSEFDSELSECSKSTLEDASHREKQKETVPPMIETDCDISIAKDMSSRRSLTSTKRFRDQPSFDFEDKSMGAYSSTTNPNHISSHGPRDRGKKPTFCTKLTDRTAAEASRIKLTCTVLGDPEPQVYWSKDGKPLPQSSNRHCTTMENELATLEFYAVTPKDSGEYSCIATNIHGQSCTEAKLKVYAGYEPTPSHPTFTRSIKDTYHPDENTLILECRVRGQPSPTITWLKDGQILQINDHYQQSDLADGICRLKIFNPDFYDSGLYTCRAENETRLSDRTSHLVNFKTSGKFRSLPSGHSSSSCIDITSSHTDTRKPRFSSHLTDHNVPAGGTIALQVEVKGAPPPEITWMRTDRKGQISVPKAQTFADSGVYTLIVPDATESETGTYVCRASNAYGHVDISANVEVVSDCTHDGGKPAMFISRPPDKDVIVATGEDVSVSFRTTGVPKPRVFWMKGLRDITSGPRSYKESHDDYVRLTLKRACPSDEGTYCILVKNRYGCDRSFFTVQVKKRARSLTPSPEWGPLDTDNLLSNIHDKERSYLKQVPGPISSEPVVTDGGRNWLALTWGKAEQRGPAPVVAYRVDAWLLGGDGGARWAELGITPINAFDAFNLRPGENYKFRITPRNRYGWGEPVTMTNSVTVREIVKFPEFTKILSGQLKALAGTVLNLEAEVTSNSMTEVKWYRDTTEIDNGQDSRFTTYFNGSKCSLMIGGISESDSGRYVCEATNAAGRVSTFVRVQVVEDIKIVEADLKFRKMRSSEMMNEERPPEFTMRLRDRRVQATYPVRLTCQVTGYPEPEVTWYKYREEIYSHDNIAIWNDEAHFHTLEISRSTIEDSGIYMARAQNVYGSVTCRCHLVVDKGIRAYIAPEFLVHLDSFYTVKAGGELRMTAQVEAYPTVGITWHRDGHRLRSSRDVIMTLNHDGTVELELAHVTLRDAGLYCCAANNEVGLAESITRVTVLDTNEAINSNQSPPQIIESTDIPYSKVPLFVTKPLSTEAFEGDTVIILCEVVGDPKPEVIWLRDFLRPDYYKDAPHFRRIGAGPQYRLEIPYAKFDFTGTYSIIAKNCHGEAKAVISLQIYARGQGKEDSGMESTIKHGNVQTLPMIKSPLKDLRCCDGDAITLVCQIHATPEPDVRWEKGGKLVALGDDFAADFDGETARLSIQHVYPEDEGEYTCVAYNDLGKAYTSACLIVDVPESKETALSRRLTKPSGFISANSTPISTPRSTPVRSISPSCTSKRELKSMMKISRAPLSDKRLRMPTGPKFYAVPHNRVAEEGETVRFQCAIAGHPAPWVTWDKDGISVTPTARISLEEKDDVRTLEIIEITHEDAGLYRITLENDVGRTEATARLEIISGRQNSMSRSIRTRSASPRSQSVYGRSHLSPSPRSDSRLQPPRVSDPYSNKGETISPTLSRWHQRNGKQSVETDTKSVKNGSATMKSSTSIIRSSSIPRQISKKKFESKDISGSQLKLEKTINTQTTPCSPPKQPSTIPKRVGINSNPKLSKKSSNTAISSTNASNNSKIPVHNDFDDISKSIVTTTKKIIPTNITDNTKKYLSIKTKSPIILTAPADVIALRGGKVTLLATYDGYPKPTVKWLRKGHDMTLDDKAEIETGAGLTCLTLIDITTNESGKYEVRIENTIGSDSRYVNVTVEGPPEPPADKPTIQNITPSGGVIIAWRTPVYDGGCAVTGYTVEMRRGDEPCWIAVAEARHSLTHTVQELNPMESYRFRVKAENIHGLSEPGMESDVITIPSGPITDERNNKLSPVEINNENESQDEDEFEPAFQARIVSTEAGGLFNERYDVLEELGKGRYGIVRRIIDKTTGLNLAAKFVRTIKSKDRQQVHDEINIMNMLRHPKLLRLAAAFANPKEMIMVTEYISGGELFERVVADDFTLTEKDSILFVRQICQGVKYMHDNNVVHLDLKPENIMCQTRTSHRIKLIDFGLAQTLKPDTPVRVLFGTPEFIPPEIIDFEPIGTESDMWSVGVICYVLLSGLSPFMGENDAETFVNITRADHDFDDKAFHAISEEAQDFISALLIKRKELRMSATDCLKHPWLAQRDESMSRVALPTDKLKKFIVRRKWQKTGNAIRALGRMASLSASSRRNTSTSPPLLKPSHEDINSETFTDNVHEEPIIEHTADFLPPPFEISPVESKNISYNDEIEIEEIDDNVDKLQTSADLSLDEALEQNSIDLENADSLTMIETQRSCSFDEYTKIENIENISTFDEANSIMSENIDEDHSNADSTPEHPMTSDEVSSDNDAMFTAIDSSTNDNTATIDISPTSLQSVTNEYENDQWNYSTFKNFHISDPINESTAHMMDTIKSVEKAEEEKIVECRESTENNKQEASNTSENQAAFTRPNFIAIKSYSNTIDYTSKPWSKTNPSNLDAEGETARIKTCSPLRRVVCTGSVSRTAKMFEQEELSSPTRQQTSPGSRIVIPTPDARPQNERIRKAFAFWNK